MNTINRAVNAVKDGYLYAIDGIAKNPQTTFWVVGGLLVLAVLF